MLQRNLKKRAPKSSKALPHPPGHWRSMAVIFVTLFLTLLSRVAKGFKTLNLNTRSERQQGLRNSKDWKHASCRGILQSVQSHSSFSCEELHGLMITLHETSMLPVASTPGCQTFPSGRRIINKPCDLSTLSAIVEYDHRPPCQEECSTHWSAMKQTRTRYDSKEISKTLHTFGEVPGCAVHAGEKTARSKPIKYMLTVHLQHVIEKEFERKQQRIWNIRKQALELSLIVTLNTECKRLRDGWKEKKLPLDVEDTDQFAISTEAREWCYTVKERHHIHT